MSTHAAGLWANILHFGPIAMTSNSFLLLTKPSTPLQLFTMLDREFVRRIEALIFSSSRIWSWDR